MFLILSLLIQFDQMACIAIRVASFSHGSEAVFRVRRKETERSV